MGPTAGKRREIEARDLAVRQDLSPFETEQLADGTRDPFARDKQRLLLEPRHYLLEAASDTLDECGVGLAAERGLARLECGLRLIDRTHVPRAQGAFRKRRLDRHLEPPQLVADNGGGLLRALQRAGGYQPDRQAQVADAPARGDPLTTTPL